MHAIAYGTVSSGILNGSSHGLSVGVADSNLFRWDPSHFASSARDRDDSATSQTGYRAEPGRRFGRYRLITQLGRGRQADVWQAERCEPKAGLVALKILNDPDGDPRRAAQLRREAERCKRLASPALLTVYEFGIEHGMPFMAMPLVIGCTLAQAIGQRRAETSGLRSSGSHRLAVMPEPRYTHAIVGVVARVARAVADAHAAHVVHRDIKPGNILLPTDHEQGVYLCDFGLGRDLDVATPFQLRDGAGSPLYMAPERLLKKHADEVLCDVYALGVTLYEALTLAFPFNVPPSLRSEDWPAFLAAAEPTRPSALRPMPEALEAVVLRAIDRDPRGRQPTAARLADELESSIAA